MRRMLALTVLCVVASGAADARTFGPGDMERIADTSRYNEARFDRDYKGRVFDGMLTFSSADKGWFGQATVQFGDDAFCIYNSQTILQYTIDWIDGQQVHVHGVIGYTILGAIALYHCVLD